MSSKKDSISNTIRIAFLVCLVCSIVVSYAAISLKPLQQLNKTLEVKKNILAAAGLYDASKSIEDQFGVISTKLVDLRTGTYATDLDVATYDQRKASKDPKRSDKLDADTDIASIKRLENYAKVYEVIENGELKTLILPIRGYALWSTLWGFVALEADLNTVVGLGFYEHAETPGLGGEIDNPKWKALWPGKQLYKNEVVSLEVIKGKVPSDDQNLAYKVDGLSGATLTSRGVTNMLKYWFSDSGYANLFSELEYES